MTLNCSFIMSEKGAFLMKKYGVAKYDPIKYNLKEIIMDKEIKLLETIAEAVIKQLRIEGFEI